jgi:hypothetical protein
MAYKFASEIVGIKLQIRGVHQPRIGLRAGAKKAATTAGE